ncbi:polysaccharide lyase family 1 protein [Glonium stellatum]|uniref:pectin lyase n=1 Tax=Glonium stellatum TaxID=574774 RepID=A0A8E2JSK0_9PEZI|nr:polysaccharide lyase family 1 protein [Glonium stellatum]
MKQFITSSLLRFLFLTGQSVAVGVVGTPPGFAASTTGGGSATPQYPADITELKSWLTDSTTRVIVLGKEYNFIGSEGTVTETGCRPTSNTCPGNGGQDAINHADWCTNGNAGTGATSITVTYDEAGVSPIDVGPNKSIIGIGSSGVIRGKGLRVANGSKNNVIIRNIHITELNPQYIWGGDAITLAGSDLIWIDHVKISLIGRQHIVLGTSASNRVSITNNEIDSVLYFTGSNDLITLKGNYIHHTSGRSPKVSGNTLLHAVNNYWHANTGHAFDVSSGGMVVAEGNVFQNVNAPLLLPATSQVFASPDTTTNKACSTYLGHVCELNAFGSSGSFPGTDTDFFSDFSGKTIASAGSNSGVAASAVANAGIGKI